MTYLTRYGEHLFGHPVTRDSEGTALKVVERTNNEHFFGRSKQQVRRRTGRASLARDLAEQPAQAALVENLRDPGYVAVLCGTLEQLPSAFAALDAHPTQILRPIQREQPDGNLKRAVRELLESKSAPSEDVADRPEAAGHHPTAFPAAPELAEPPTVPPPMLWAELARTPSEPSYLHAPP